MPASRPWVQRTAFGRPVVPDVKRSRKSASSGTSAAPATRARADAPPSAPSGWTRGHLVGVGLGPHDEDPRRARRRRRARPARSAPSSSVTSSWQSVARTSAARASPRRVGLMPTIVAPASAAPHSQNRYSGTFGSRTPMCSGPGRRSDCASAPRAAPAATVSRHVQRPPASTTAGWSSSARAASSSATDVTRRCSRGGVHGAVFMAPGGRASGRGRRRSGRRREPSCGAARPRTS